MHPFLRKILEATRLTRAGKVAEATSVIQEALSPARQAGTHTAAESQAASDDVIDIEVVEVADPPMHGETARPSSGAALADPVAEESVIVDAPPVAPSAPRFVESSFTGSGGTRAFKLFMPSGCEGEALPLVVMLHGCTQDAEDFGTGTKMNEIAQEQGFLVLYPEQSERANGHRCWNWFSPPHQRRGSGEQALIAGMTRHILQTHSVDHDRVFVAGLSAGGAMAAILAREYPDVFAAAGVHSGVDAGDARNVISALAVMRSGPSRERAQSALTAEAPRSPRPSAAPLIVFHGDADRTVALANADALLDSALTDSRLVATTSQGMAATGERSFRRTVWRRGDDEGSPSVAERWVVHGAGHAWSGGDATGSYTDPSGPDASREMLRFFAEHPRADAVTAPFTAQGESDGTAP